MSENLCDVLAVSLENSTVRFMAKNKSRANAEAVVGMAVMRRGVDEEFYIAVAAGTYKEGEKWEGQRAECRVDRYGEPGWVL